VVVVQLQRELEPEVVRQVPDGPGKDAAQRRRKAPKDVAGGHGREEAGLLVRVKQAATRYKGLNADAVRKPSRQVQFATTVPDQPRLRLQ
jgi:hypothetical protein